MSLVEELKDPWGLLVAGVSGGMVWALMGSTPVGLAVGAAVLGVKAVSGLLLPGGSPQRPALPEPPRGSAADHWLQRCETAVRGITELAAGGPAAGTAEQARDTLSAAARLGGQTVVLERALARVDDGGLESEAARLAEAARRGGPPGMLAEIQRSAAAVADRIAVRDRLLVARDTVVARLQATALGLESVGARLAEVVALAETAGGGHDTSAEVAALGGEVEALRAGLAEVEALSRSVLAPGA